MSSAAIQAVSANDDPSTDGRVDGTFLYSLLSRSSRPPLVLLYALIHTHMRHGTGNATARAARRGDAGSASQHTCPDGEKAVAETAIRRLRTRSCTVASYKRPCLGGNVGWSVYASAVLTDGWWVVCMCVTVIRCWAKWRPSAQVRAIPFTHLFVCCLERSTLTV